MSEDPVDQFIALVLEQPHRIAGPDEDGARRAVITGAAKFFFEEVAKAPPRAHFVPVRPRHLHPADGWQKRARVGFGGRFLGQR